MTDNTAFEGEPGSVKNGSAGPGGYTTAVEMAKVDDQPPSYSAGMTKEDNDDDDHDKVAEVERQKLRDRDPFFYCRFIVAWPRLAFGE